jgi:hypothetical protein
MRMRKQGRQVVDQFERMRWMFHTLFPKVNVDPAEPIVDPRSSRITRCFQTLEPAEYLSQRPDAPGRSVSQDAGQELRAAGSRRGTRASLTRPCITNTPTCSSRAQANGCRCGSTRVSPNSSRTPTSTTKTFSLGQPSVERHYYYLRQNQLMPLETLFRVDHNSPYYHDEQKGSVFYAQSWALTHYLEVNDNLKHLHQDERLHDADEPP